ncbi:MAG: hypothetical protein JWN14_5084 [Chthonomonadales bacterium]|nr:hypothetical protein [Chthonomonadales bacterium]
MRSRILLGSIAGGVGGLVGGVISEALIPYNSYIHRSAAGGCEALQPTTPWPGIILAFFVYGLIALLLGGVDGVVEGNPRKLVRGVLLGLFGGVVLGMLGSQFGHEFYRLLGGKDSTLDDPSLFGFVRQIIARGVLFAFTGTGIGVGAALATMTPKRIFQGGLGGLIGGTIGGMLLDLLGILMKPLHSVVQAGCYDAAGPGRMLSYVLIGVLTGFFIGLMQELFKQAWVKVLAGRNEGKDFILSKPMNLLGREERCDVPLYGDLSVGVQHAAIRADGKRHVLLDAGTPIGTMVNGQRVDPGKEQLLRDGDMIQIGQHRILFREKATQSKFAHKPIDEPKVKPNAASVPMPSHLCPFCGAPKDATGKCLCSLGNGGPANTPVGSGVGMSGMNPDPGFGAPPPGFGAPPDMGGYGAPPMPGPNTTMPGFGGPSLGFGAPIPPMAAIGQLTSVEGPYAGQVFALVAANTTVGRETTSDIVLSADTTISRTHARLINEGGNYVVYDNGSSNGTFVNGMRLSSPVALAPGDIVQFGGSKFRFE